MNSPSKGVMTSKNSRKKTNNWFCLINGRTVADLHKSSYQWESTNQSERENLPLNVALISAVNLLPRPDK